MKFCVKCGQQLEDGQAFCPSCGAAQEVAAVAATPGAGQQQAPQQTYGGAPQQPYGGAPQQTYGGQMQQPYGGAPQQTYGGQPQQPYGRAPQQPYGGQFNAAGANSIVNVGGKGFTLPDVLVAAGCIVALIVSFFPHFSMEVWGLKESLNFFGVGIIGPIGFLAALACLVVLLVDKFVKPLGKIPFILGIVQIPVVAIYVLAMLVQFSGEEIQMAKEMGMKAGFGIGFFLYLIAIIVVIVGTFMGKKAN